MANEIAKRDAIQPRGAYGRHGDETHEKRARRLFDEQARNVGRELVNYMKYMWPDVFVGKPSTFEISIVNHVRNDINWRMRPLLMAMIAMHQEWEAESQTEHDPAQARDISSSTQGDDA